MWAISHSKSPAFRHRYRKPVGLGKKQVLMSKFSSPIRTAVTCVVIVLQLALLPLTHVLHTGCSQSGHGTAVSGSTFPTLSVPVHRCKHSSGGHKHGSNSQDSPPVAPHDSEDCAVCQVVLAARIGNLHTAEVQSDDVLAVSCPLQAPEVCEALGYRASGRGPPV